MTISTPPQATVRTPRREPKLWTWIATIAAVNAMLYGSAWLLTRFEPVLAGEGWWLVARAGGATAFALLTLLTLLGFAMSHPGWKGAWLASALVWHRALAVVSVAFVVSHVSAVALDPYVAIGWRGVLVPGLSRWRPGAVDLGLFSLYWMGVVTLSAWLSRPLGRLRWLHLHRFAWLSWVGAWFHGLWAGTDSRIWTTGYVLAGAAVVGTALARFWSPRRPPRRHRAAEAASGGARAETSAAVSGKLP